MNEETFKGSCLCGQVSYIVRPPAVFFQYCHCSRCRKRSGSAHCANMMFKVEQFAWDKGEALAKRFELPTAKHFCSGFCSVCGSAVPWITRNGKFVLVPAGTLDESPPVFPERNVHFGSRASWYRAASELPVFDEELTR